MTFVETVIANWHALPGKVQGAICAMGSGALGYLELMMETGQGLPPLKQVAMHAGSAALVGLLGYMVPNWRQRGLQAVQQVPVVTPPPIQTPKQ